jgi:hypothetical protein
MVNYNIPAVRVARRFVVVFLSAAITVFVTKIDPAPDKIIDSILALTSQDWLYFLKVGLGAGLLVGLDKLKRELGL